MVLNKREKYIAIGTGAAALLFLLDYMVFTPYFEARGAVEKDLAAAKLTQKDNADLMTKQNWLKPVFASMKANGLTVESTIAESQSQHAILDWANSADFNLQSIKPERTTQDGKFMINGFSVTGIATTPALARLLWAVESAKLPVRITDLDVRPRKDGMDDLQVRMSVSVLCMPPDLTASANTTGGAR